jgi:hypothetical protein
MRIPTFDRAAKAAVVVAMAAAVATLPGVAHAAAPVANDDSATGEMNEPTVIDVLANDTSDAGTSLTVTTTTPPAGDGTVSCTSVGVCTYTPDAGFVGTDTFTYGVTDGSLTDTAQVTVTTVEIDRLSNLITRPGTNISDSNVTWPNEKLDIATVVTNPAGAGIPNVEVGLFAKPSGGEYTEIFSAVTNANGRAGTTNVQPVTRTSYQWRTAGTNSAARSVGVTPFLTALFSEKRVAVGGTFTVSGTSAPADLGQAVVLEKLNSTGTWSVVQTDSFDTASSEAGPATYSFTVSPEVSRADTYRVSVPAGDTGRSEAVSATAKVKAHQAEITGVEPGSAEDPDEYVTVKNTGNVGLDLKNWKLSDVDSTVLLPARTLAVGTVVKIHSGTGKNSLKHLYLGGNRNWANGEGTITLTDHNGFQLDEFAYPEVVVTP